MKRIEVTLALVALLIVAVVLGFLFGFSRTAEGTGFIGLAVTQTTATTTQVGPDEVITIFSSNPQCTSRVVSTTDGTGQNIFLLFGDPTNGDVASTSVDGVTGHVQAASTTAAYEAGTYGCGRWTVHADASTTLMLSEF